MLFTIGTMLTVKQIAAGKNDTTEIEVKSTNLKGEKETKTYTICNYDQVRPRARSLSLSLSLSLSRFAARRSRLVFASWRRLILPAA